MRADLHFLKLVRTGFDGPSGTIFLYVLCFYVDYLYYTGRNNGMIKFNCNSDEFPYKNLKLLSGGVTRELPGKCHSWGGVGWRSTFCVFDLQVTCSSSHIPKSLSYKEKYLWAMTTVPDFKHTVAAHLHSCMAKVCVHMWNPTDTFTFIFPWFKHFQVQVFRLMQTPVAKMVLILCFLLWRSVVTLVCLL